MLKNIEREFDFRRVTSDGKSEIPTPHTVAR